MSDKWFEEMIKEPKITGNQLLENLDKATSGVLHSLDIAEDPVVGPTTEITNEMLIKALEELGTHLRLPEGVIRNGVQDFQDIVDNKRGES